MWKLLPKFGLMRIIVVLLMIILYSLIMLLPKHIPFVGLQFSVSDFGSAVKTATPATILLLLILFLLGKWGWRLLWKLPLIGKALADKICPDLNGEWQGTIDSNSSEIDEHDRTKPVSARINADFFGVRMSLKSEDGYSRSEVVTCDLYRDSRTKELYLSYLFRGRINSPKESDDREFDGAAKLVIQTKEHSVKLDGDYWTNRAWQRGKNTAGRILLKKD